MAGRYDATPDFRLLGPVEVFANGRLLQLGGRRQRTLLALLMLGGDAGVSTERLAEELWNGSPPPGAATTLRSYVSRLRTVLGQDAVVARPLGYALALAFDQVDAHRFARLLHDGHEALARGAAGLAADRLQSALALWRGPAFADVADSGLLALEARRLDELRLMCLEERIEADLALGRHTGLTTELEGLVTEEPLRERLWRQLVLAYYRCERQADALAAYRRARVALRELGLEPGEELKELERAVLRHEVEAAIPGEERHNLPTSLTSFVGRERELADVERLLREHRLLTLTGVGGSGKTRLALEVAARQVGAWQGGVWLIDLTTLAEPSLLPSAVAGVLPVSGREPNASPHDALLERLRRSELLLVLDNCEHLVDACSELAEELLRGCLHLHVLATSRVPLSTAGGLDYAVNPLPVPPESATAGELERSSSVQLFLERGRVVRLDLAPAPESLSTVGRICRDLDGLPLAIELAAARVRALSLEEIGARLGDRFRFLRSRSRIADPRHQTLQATMDWSYKLLSDEKRAVLQRMSVFGGGSTLEAIAFVCCDGDQERTLELVDGLLEASLVLTAERSGETRYRLLETVRQYAAERLDEGGGDDARQLHAEFFTGLAEKATAQIRRGDVLSALAEDEGNFRSALSFSDHGREPELMLRLAAALWFYWVNVRDQAEEARHWLERAVQHRDRSPSPARARALRGLGAISIPGNPAEARAFLDGAVVLYREMDDDDGVARCLNNLGCLALEEGDLDDATTLLEEALALHRQVDERESLTPLMNLARVANRRGDLVEQRRLFQEALEAARDWQDELSAAWALVDLASLAVVEGRYEDVAPLAGEALGFCVRVGALERITDCMLLAALVQASRGHRDDAALLLAAASAQRARCGWPALPEGMYARPFEALMRELGDERHAAARAEGAALSFEDAVELAAQALNQTAKRLQPA